MSIPGTMRRLTRIRPRHLRRLMEILAPRRRFAEWYLNHGERLVYRRRFGPQELRAELKALGVSRGRTVYLHTAFSRFYNFEGTPDDLIDLVLELLGPEGTLSMPAFPPYPLQFEPDYVFDLRETPTGAGVVAERFRQREGVARSINLNHSVCALGPGSDRLLGEHHLSVTSWDEHSPFHRLSLVDGLAVGLGIGHDLRAVSPVHCMESLLRTEIGYFHDLFREDVTYHWRDAAGREWRHGFLRRAGAIDTARLRPHMDAAHYVETRLSNLEIMALDMAYFIPRLLTLGRDGVTCYLDPPPRRALFQPLDEPPRGPTFREPPPFEPTLVASPRNG